MLRRWLIMGFVGGRLTVALAGMYAWAVRPERYGDAVSEALAQRHIAYTGLEVREICLPDPHCIINGDGTRTYAAIPSALGRSPATISAAIATWMFQRKASSARRCAICAACVGCRSKWCRRSRGSWDGCGRRCDASSSGTSSE